MELATSVLAVELVGACIEFVEFSRLLGCYAAYPPIELYYYCY